MAQCRVVSERARVTAAKRALQLKRREVVRLGGKAEPVVTKRTAIKDITKPLLNGGVLLWHSRAGENSQ